MKIVQILLLVMVPGFTASASAEVFDTPEKLIYLTQEWEGERIEDGRPMVSDKILERMQKVSIEETRGVLRSKGYHNQFEGNWEMFVLPTDLGKWWTKP